jgi:putative molybdopterin biosynthesis protein
MPRTEIHSGECMRIATGALVPRGADAIVMVEYSKENGNKVHIYHSAVYGEHIAQAGSDYVIGDLFLRKGTRLTSREIASLSALGIDKVTVFLRPRVALFSTGNELVLPGAPLTSGRLYDANGMAISAMIKESGGDPDFLGILPDTYEKMLEAISKAITTYDIVVTSGSTSAGLGDMMYKVFDVLGKPGVIVHGLKLKPGKPTIVATHGSKLFFGLPGFPVSAMIVFMLLVKPVLLRLSGHNILKEKTVQMKIAYKITAGGGKRTIVPVSIVNTERDYIAYPVAGSSGTVSALNRSDGFIDIPEDVEFINEGEEVEVRLFSDQLSLPDLNIIGSHCPAVDLIISLIPKTPIVKIVNLGSLAGWNAIKRREADIAGTHLLDEETLTYNFPFLKKLGLEKDAVIIKGYNRMQGMILSKGNPKKIGSFNDIISKDIRFINRNKGSGTRTFIDHKLKTIAESKSQTISNLAEGIKGYTYEAKTHSAVALAVFQSRADVGIGLEYYALKYNLDFIPLVDEEYDFLVLRERLDRAIVTNFLEALKSREFQKMLPEQFKGYKVTEKTGKMI